MVPHSLRRGAVVIAVCLVAALQAVVAKAADGKLHLYWVDSEGGGSTLVVTPAGESVLIDSGNPGGRDSARIHKVATEVAGLKRIDHLIVTHFHIDHFGGAAELGALMPIGHLWDNGLTDADPDGRRESTWPLTSKPYRQMAVDQRHRVEPGTLLPLKSEGAPIFLRCVITRQTAWRPAGEGASVWKARPGVKLPEPAKGKDTSDNANSSAWVLGFGGFRFYDGGDLTWNTEATLVSPEILVPEVDLYQVTHHGLDVSNHPGLLRALNPTVTVMNNGPTKGAMAEVFQTLKALPDLQAQFQVHRNIRPDGATNNCPDAHIANREASCAGHYIHCAVAADGRSFTVGIPAHGGERRFAVRGGSR